MSREYWKNENFYFIVKYVIQTGEKIMKWITERKQFQKFDDRYEPQLKIIQSENRNKGNEIQKVFNPKECGQMTSQNNFFVSTISSKTVSVRRIQLMEVLKRSW